MTERTRWLLLLVLPPLFWAGNALVGRAVVGDIPPVALSFWRWVLAAIMILPFTATSLKLHAPVLRRHWVAVVALGLFSVAAYNTLLYLALQTTTAINATLVGACLPLMVLVIARLWLGEPIRPRQALGILVSLLGLVAVVARGDPARLAALTFSAGDLLMLAATLSWSIYSVMLRRYPLAVPGFTLLAALILVGVVAILPVYLWELAEGGRMSVSPGSLAAIGYTALFASLLAYYFWNRGVAVVGASVAGQFTYLIPLFTAVLAVLLLGEQFRAFHALGGGLIFAGIGLATLGRRR
ncbi:MAG: DMT family transporter [Solirubrobacterales bacterium]